MNIATLRSNYKTMPWLLKCFTGAFLCFIVFLPVSLMPFLNFSINGESVTYAEFWSRGGGLVFCSIGIFCPMLGIGFLSKNKYARMTPALLVTIPSTVIVLTFAKDIFLELVFELVAISAFTVWYFYYKKSVIAYFELDKIHFEPDASVNADKPR